MKRDAADRRFSLMIRERDGFTCQRCGVQYDRAHSHNLDSAHCFGRWKGSTRTDPDDAAALCRLCHGYLDSHPEQKREWFRQRLGDERYEALQRRSNRRSA